MNLVASTDQSRRSLAARTPFYYGWVNVVVAAAAMTATLPGRTFGLGLITSPLLAELQISQQSYASMNLAATLLGALFCIPAGRIIDRWGVRAATPAILVGLAGAT